MSIIFKATNIPEFYANHRRNATIKIRRNWILRNPEIPYNKKLAFVKNGQVLKFLGPTHKKDIKKYGSPPFGYVITKNRELRKLTTSLRKIIRKRGNQIIHGLEVSATEYNVELSKEMALKHYPRIRALGKNFSGIYDFFKEIFTDWGIWNTREIHSIQLVGYILPDGDLKRGYMVYTYPALNDPKPWLNAWGQMTRNGLEKNTIGKVFDGTYEKVLFKIQTFKNIPARYHYQFYQEAEEGNCVINEVKKWVNTLKGKSKPTYEKRIQDLENKYKITGVDINGLKEISEKLNLKFIIKNIVGDTRYIINSPKKRQMNTITLTNSRFNHLSPEIFLSVNSPSIIVPQNELDELAKTSAIWLGTFNKPTKVFKECGTYATQESENINKFFKRIDQYKIINPPEEIAKFIHSSQNFIGCKVFPTGKEYVYDLDTETREIPTYPEKMYEIDSKNCYANYHLNPEFKGIPIPTQYGKTNKILGEGFYLVENFKPISPHLKLIFQNENLTELIFNATTLRTFEKNNWATFEIVYGVYASPNTEIKDPIFTKEEIENKDYKKFSGIMSKFTNKTIFHTRGNREFAELLANDGYDITTLGKFIQIKKNKSNIILYNHITSSILGNTLDLLLIQLHKSHLNEIIKITTDSIITTNKNIEIIPPFRVKNENYKIGMNYNIGIFNIKDPLPKLPEVQAPNIPKISTYIGPGGSGKTTYIKNMPIISPVYSVDSNLLTNSQDWARPVNWTLLQAKKFKNLHFIIIDEVSKMTFEEQTKLIELYPNSSIVFIGDIGYQLPPFNKGREAKLLGEIKKFDYVHRFKCEKLRRYANELRNVIDTNDIKKFQMLKNEIPYGNLNNYKVSDYVLCWTREMVRNLTEKLKNKGEKYLITKNNKKYYNGQIVFNKPNAQFSPRHAFTTHQIQGRTITEKIYIKLENSSMRHFYTSVSRAVNFDQLRIV